MAEYIEREYLKDTFRIIISECKIEGDNEGANIFRDVIDIIDEIQPDDVAPVRHGRWMGTVCSACGGSTSYYYDCDYCPHCGAKMDLEG